MKGVTLLVTIIWTLIILFIAFYIAAKIVAPLFWNEKTDVSYQNLLILDNKIKGLEASDLSIDRDEFMFEIERDYYLVAYDSKPKDTTLFCAQDYDVKVNLKSPDLCDGKACICLYKEDPETSKPVGCKTYNNAEFFAIKESDYDPNWYLSETKRKNLMQGCEKIGHPYTKNKYKSIVIVGQNDAKTIFWGKTKVYLEKYTKNNINYFTLTRKDISMDVRFNKINTCPQESDVECKGKHYEQVIRDGKKTNYCDYKKDQKKCVLEDVNNCKSGFIDTKCACGDYVMDGGVCINNKFYFFEITDDYCFENKIKSSDSCDAYNNGDYRDVYPCVLNPCGIKSSCVWNGGQTGANYCETCNKPTDGSCSDYNDDHPWMRFLDYCDYDEDGKTLDQETDDCFKCDSTPECGDYDTPFLCQTDQCGLNGKHVKSYSQDSVYFCTPVQNGQNFECKTEEIDCSQNCRQAYTDENTCSAAYNWALNKQQGQSICQEMCAPEYDQDGSYVDCMDCINTKCSNLNKEQCANDPCKLYRRQMLATQCVVKTTYPLGAFDPTIKEDKCFEEAYSS